MPPSFPQAAPQALHADSDGYTALLEVATAPLQQLGDHVVVEVERLDCLGRWAFLLGTMRTPGGERPDWRGTPYAEPAAAGSMSDVYVALLRRDPEGEQANAALGDGADGEAVNVDADPASAMDTSECLAAPGQWVLLDHAIGPGDVAWLDWPTEHAAPRAVFGF